MVRFTMPPYHEADFPDAYSDGDAPGLTVLAYKEGVGFGAGWEGSCGLSWAEVEILIDTLTWMLEHHRQEGGR